MKTAAIPFFQCNAKGDQLFVVQAGVDLADALIWASSLLDTAIGLLEDEESRSAQGAMVLAQMAKAAIDALEVPHV
ncbi:MAG: DUF3077 domain-containing protein [Rhodocyclales bacterium GT-UBC]|nr:MAG: DUF3077 domain-containing protein [Rhodocyclales bacterium GT-UBC]